jgi:ankyrin repeat protein
MASNGLTQLRRAIKRGQIDEVKRLLEEGVLVNGSQQGWTPLFDAAARGDTAMIRLLRDRGADINQGLERNFTAILAAVLRGHLPAVQALLEAGARPIAPNGISLSKYAPDTKAGREIARILTDLEANL